MGRSSGGNQRTSTISGDAGVGRRGGVGAVVVRREPAPVDDVDPAVAGVDHHHGRLVDLDVDAELLPDLPADGVGRLLAPLEQAAGEAPRLPPPVGLAHAGGGRRRPARSRRWRPTWNDGVSARTTTQAAGQRQPAVDGPGAAGCSRRPDGRRAGGHAVSGARPGPRGPRPAASAVAAATGVRRSARPRVTRSRPAASTTTPARLLADEHAAQVVPGAVGVAAAVDVGVELAASHRAEVEGGRAQGPELAPAEVGRAASRSARRRRRPSSGSRWWRAGVPLQRGARRPGPPRSGRRWPG